MSKKLYIGKLSEKITDEQLSDVFSKIGRVISIKIIKVISQEKNMNYGYVQMDTDDNTSKAIKALNNSILDGSRIKVTEAHFLDQEKTHYYQQVKRRKY